MRRRRMGSYACGIFNINRPLLLLICTALSFLPIILWSTSGRADPNLDDPLGFIPADMRQSSERFKCEDLFRATFPNDIIYKNQYIKTIKLFVNISHSKEDELSPYSKINDAAQLYRAIQYIVLKSKARTACIAGHNTGQAALHILGIHKYTIVHAFRRSTPGQQSYKIDEFLNKKFKNRLHVYDGNTVETIPRFLSANRDQVFCDLAVIAGPMDYDTARADITNMARLAHFGRNYIIFVDHLQQSETLKGSGNAGILGNGREPGKIGKGKMEAVKAWDESCSNGLITQKIHCDFIVVPPTDSYNPYTGFAIGVVERRPDSRDDFGAQDKLQAQISTPSLPVIEMGKRTGPVASVDVVTPPSENLPRMGKLIKRDLKPLSPPKDDVRNSVFYTSTSAHVAQERSEKHDKNNVDSNNELEKGSIRFHNNNVKDVSNRTEAKFTEASAIFSVLETNRKTDLRVVGNSIGLKNETESDFNVSTVSKSILSSSRNRTSNRKIKYRRANKPLKT